MDRLTRYLFIVLGFVIFLVLAPLIVLYISGTRFNLNSHETTATGLLVAKSEPTGADVFLDDEKKDSTPATIRFLDRGDYTVKITKQGYLPWTKKLPVETSKVTYTYEGVDAVNLLREPIPQTLPTSGATSAIVFDDVIWYSANNSINFAPLNRATQFTKITLPFTPNSLSIMRDSVFLLAQNTNGKKALINRSTQATFILPDSFKDATDFNITTNNFLVYRNGDSVSSYNLTTHAITPLLHEIAGFTLLGNIGYAAVRDGHTTLQTIEWTGDGFSNAEPIINSQVPEDGDCQLIITKGKELFVLSGSNFYRANAPLELISSHVKNVALDPTTEELTFSTPSELWFYNFGSAKPQLLTRTTDTINTFIIRENIGYGFIGTASGLEALEIDSRDQQNRYELLKDNAVWAVGLSSDEKTAVALQNGQLLLIPIR